jgi:hypothetical protein
MGYPYFFVKTSYLYYIKYIFLCCIIYKKIFFEKLTYLYNKKRNGRKEIIS